MKRVRVGELALLLGALAIAILVLEGALRAVQQVQSDVPFLSLLPGYRESQFQRSPFLVFGPRVDWTFQRDGNGEWTRFNDLGLRLPWPLPPRAEGEVRILALGGSTTENVWNELGIHWPLGLECILRESGRTDVRVLNAGMSAYTTAHSLVRYQLDLAEIAPDLVLIMHNVNDLSVTYNAAARDEPVDPNYLVKYGSREHTGIVTEEDVVFFRLGRAISSRLFAAPDAELLPSTAWEYDLDLGTRYFRRNLVRLVNAVRDDGALPVLVTMPRSDDPAWIDQARAQANSGAGVSLLPEASQFFEDFDQFNAVVREVAAESQVPLVDMARRLEAAPEDFVDMVHYSTSGIRRFSHVFAEGVDAYLPQPPERSIPLGRLVPCEGVFNQREP